MLVLFVFLGFFTGYFSIAAFLAGILNAESSSVFSIFMSSVLATAAFMAFYAAVTLA